MHVDLEEFCLSEKEGQEVNATDCFDEKGAASSPYSMYEDGFYWFSADQKAVRLCQRFEVDQLIGDSVTEDAIRLRFMDRNNQERSLVVLRKDLIGRSEKVQRDLASLGFDMSVTPRNQKRLKDYLFNHNPASACVQVDKPGFHGQLYIQPNLTIGAGDNRLHYSGHSTLHAEMAQAGTLEGWREHVANLCIGNPLLMLAVSASFAAVLPALLELQPFGLHIWGRSSTGKSTLAKLANSVWGSDTRIRSWRMTQAGLERLARSYNDTLVVLDEIDEVPRKLLGPIVYQLGNGRTRSLGTGGGEMLRLLHFSTGEKSLRQMLEQEQTELMAGQIVRQINLSVDAGGRYGLFENLHGRPSPGVLVEELGHACNVDYGEAILFFLNKICQMDLADLKARYADLTKDFYAKHLPEGGSGVQRRVAKNFCLCALAGELATEWGVTGWGADEASAAAARMYQAWLVEQMSSAERQLRSIVEQLQAFVISHQSQILIKGSQEQKRPSSKEWIGFQQNFGESEFHCLLATVFTKQALRGFDAAEATQLLVDGGLLIPNLKEETPYLTMRFPVAGENKPSRGYRLKDLLKW